MEDCVQTKKDIINEQITSTNSLKVHQVKGDSYKEGEQIKPQKCSREERNLDQRTVRYIPSPDPLAIATSQVFSKDYEAMPLESPSNIYEARVYNYSKVEYSTLKKQEKPKFVSQVEKCLSTPAIPSSIGDHNTSTFSNIREIVSKNTDKYHKIKKINCNININDLNDDEPQALNLEVAKVCKLKPKIDCSIPQSQENKFISKINIPNISNMKKVIKDESGNLLRNVPLSTKKDPITNKGRFEKEDTNLRIYLRRSSRVPKLKKDSEEVFDDDHYASSQRTKIQDVLKINDARTGDSWKCKRCDAIFRDSDSLMRHHECCHLFTCHSCNWKGSTHTDYEKHISTEHFKQDNQCLACREEFSSYKLYREHMINVHKIITGSDEESNATVNQHQQAYPKSNEYISIKNKLLPDNIKKFKGIKREYEDTHQTNHDNCVSDDIERTSSHTVTGNKKCPYCPKSFMRQSRLVRHLNYHLGKKSFVCSVCKKSFVEKSGIDAHMLTHNPVNAACKHCEKVFKTHRTLKRHLQTHKNRTYVCELCGKVYRHMESLRVHSLTHNKWGSGNTCDLCNKDCKTSYYLQVHLKTKHESAKFECKDCNKFFKWKQSFVKHKNLFHNDPDDDIDTESVTDNLTSKSKVECGDCSQPFSCMSDLLKHQESHGKEAKHTCDLCDKKFKHAFTRNKHIKTVHEDSNEHKCAQCGAKFKAKEYLDQHISYVHTTKDRVKCGQCENDFKTKANLKSHIKTVHGHKKRKYTCKNCKKSFSSPKDLERHQKIHSKLQNFQCPVCQRSFSRKDNMTAHLRIHTDTEPAARPPANSVSFESSIISSENQILSATNTTSPVDADSLQNVCEPITLILPGNDITVSSSQMPCDIPASTKQYKCSFSPSITSASAMPHQMITTVSHGMPLGKDVHTSTATCILTVPNASLSLSPNVHTVSTPTSIVTSFIDLSNGSSSISSPSSSLSSSSASPLITLTSSSTALSSSSASPLITLTTSSLSSLTSPMVLPVTHLNKDSDSSIEVEVVTDLPQTTDHSGLQQDNVVVGEGILPLITPTQTHFSEPHVVYTILEDGSSKLETLESLSIHPLSPGSTSGEVEFRARKHQPMDS